MALRPAASRLSASCAASSERADNQYGGASAMPTGYAVRRRAHHGGADTVCTGRAPNRGCDRRSSASTHSYEAVRLGVEHLEAGRVDLGLMRDLMHRRLMGRSRAADAAAHEVGKLRDRLNGRVEI